MTQEDLTFYTINNTITTIPLKQKIYMFSDAEPDFHQTRRNPERTNRKKELHHENDKQLHNVWKPTIPSKKLFEEPKFFLSLERKKFRIINGIKNMSLFCEREPSPSTLKGKKVKQGGLSLRKISSSQEPQEMSPLESTGRIGWQPNIKTPYLNFNMQYLLKKRKSMTPNLYKGIEKMSKTSSASFK